MNFSVVIASSRHDGNTAKLAKAIAQMLQARVIDLSEFTISYFDYEHRNADDDFIPIIEQLLSSDFIIFATPVYWYAMSAQLKTFFDRFTDLLTTEQDLGRKLRGMPISVVATGSDAQLPLSFTQQFELIARYLGLILHPGLYCCCQDDIELCQHRPAIQSYVNSLP